MNELENKKTAQEPNIEARIESKRAIIDNIAELEAKALLDGLKDVEVRKNPAFLEKVRRFLKDHKLETTDNLVTIVAKAEGGKEIPIFDEVE